MAWLERKLLGRTQENFETCTIGLRLRGNVCSLKFTSWWLKSIPLATLLRKLHCWFLSHWSIRSGHTCGWELRRYAKRKQTRKPKILLISTIIMNNRIFSNLSFLSSFWLNINAPQFWKWLISEFLSKPLLTSSPHPVLLEKALAELLPNE